MITGDAKFRGGLAEFVHHGVMGKMAAASGVKVAPLSDVAKDPPLQSRLEHGRWIADCPAPDCGGAEYVWEQGLMMCCSCWNRDIGGKWRRVTFPDERLEIEDILKARPKPVTQNWRPAETVAALRAENRKHRLPERGR